MITIGYWRQVEGIPLDRCDEGKNLPWPGDLVDPNADPILLETVATYLDNGKKGAYSGDKFHYGSGWRGMSNCRLCGKHNGSTDMTDGVYVWPQGLSHYVRSHKVVLDAAFIEHVKKEREHDRVQRA